MIRGIDFDVVNAASGPKARLNNTGAAGQRRVQTNRGAFNNENVAPPSVDIQIPNGGRLGAKLTAPARDTALTPRTPRVEPTYMVLPSITMEEVARPSNAGPLEAGAVITPNGGPNTAPQSTQPAGTEVLLASFTQVLPPSVDL